MRLGGSPRELPEPVVEKFTRWQMKKWRSIWKSEDGEPVEPPVHVDTLLTEVWAAIQKYIGPGPFENFPDNVEEWGGCPECHENHGFLFDWKDIWFICQTHRKKWWVGSGLFSAWEHQTDEYLTAQRLELMAYKSCQPWHPGMTAAEEAAAEETLKKDAKEKFLKNLPNMEAK
jgi:hypothetical protein